jgi:hypothetical protein
MLRRARRRLTFANVCSFLALTIALGAGGAYAANTIGSSDIIDNSIQSVDVKDRGLHNIDIAASQITGSLVKDGSLTGSDIGGKVADADTLDGIDSAGFVNGTGNADGQSIDPSPNTTTFLGPAIGGFIRLRYQCPAGLGSNGALRIVNGSVSQANLFVDSGGANPDYFTLSSGGFVDYPAAPGGESFRIQALGSLGVITVDVATVHRAATNDCHAQAVGVLAR